MGGQGFIPEDGEGSLVEGAKEARELRKEHDYEYPHGAPRAGMQGNEERGAAPEKRLDRPGTTPEDKTPAGGRVDAGRALKHEEE